MLEEVGFGVLRGVGYPGCFILVVFVEEASVEVSVLKEQGGLEGEVFEAGCMLQ